ncbi:abortive infection family protein [Stenotrophomonas maltophilia]|nr:abortive infection family protein [Stenotrophomonas maltophilia]
MSSIIDGIGAYRTHAGSAHGQHKRSYKMAPRQARLVVHSAHSLCLRVVETWRECKRGSAGKFIEESRS